MELGEGSPALEQEALEDQPETVITAEDILAKGIEIASDVSCNVCMCTFNVTELALTLVNLPVAFMPVLYILSVFPA